MAKRKRLMPAQATYLAPDAPSSSATGGLLGAATAPIAQIASEASATAALEELSDVLESARAKGLMIEELALDQIGETYLVRDRILQDEDDMQALMGSIALRGQQTPIEVVRLDPAKNRDGNPARAGHMYGLISGWRRLAALRRLYTERADPKYAQVRALVVQPDSAVASYVAMVEENEIRVNLSQYERARIAVKALEMGLYEDRRKAILGLFGNASRTKRSKIASFATLVEVLDPVLQYPTAISEKLGLALAQRLEEARGGRDALVQSLEVRKPTSVSEEIEALNIWLAREKQNGADETEVVAAVVARDTGGLRPEDPLARPLSDPTLAPGADRSEPSGGSTARPARPAVSVKIVAGVQVTFAGKRIELQGDSVDEALLQALKRWLEQR